MLCQCNGSATPRMSLRLVFGFPAKAENGSLGELENKTLRLKLTRQCQYHRADRWRSSVLPYS